MTRKLLLCGGSGLLGRALVQNLVHSGDQIVLLVRRPPRPLAEPNIIEHVVGLRATNVKINGARFKVD